ncbi:phage integrase Arm DNA-binding domain-containing protein [Aliikangiella coralliicola]|uniref:Tyrosine-type recombinase/integrase n=1 Tax=Aliikangiella coralliicola TaxID=2592383 RepID=A0A545U025_9GAMM|nr:phage integrase Arm DNA-binding domain-containing protein [Aliikangiella coralliicola]TQV82814.1 tyrosine-type recombinase/integrase [Aliikangiella coralliicola]
MSPKKRNKLNNHGIENLYLSKDKRTNRVYAQYKDPRDGKFKGLGPDIAKAKHRAKMLNVAIYGMLEKQKLELLLSSDKQELTVEEWAVHYVAELTKQYKSGEISYNTFNGRKSHIKPLRIFHGDTLLRAITTKQITGILNTYYDDDKRSMAQKIIVGLHDFFRSAIAEGEAETNPLDVIKKKSIVIKRARFTEESINQVLQTLNTVTRPRFQPWLINSIWLAITTGQRLEDITKFRFRKGRDWEKLYQKRIAGDKRAKPYSYIDGDHLHVFQQKTGNMLRIPLALRNNVFNVSVREAVERCKIYSFAVNLIHHAKSNGTVRKGTPVSPKTLSKKFSELVSLSNIDWGENTPATFHELRSLAERTYKKQGVNTSTLLGHKNPQMTAKYHDARGFDWETVHVR